MRIWIVTLALICLAIAASAKTPATFASRWDAVRQQAAAAHKPIFLHFTTTWCGWCRKIESETYTDARVKAALADFAAASLDCTVPRGAKPSGDTKVHLDLLAKYGGEGYPYLVVLSEDGQAVLRTISGYLPPTEFLAELEAARALHGEYLAFREYARTADVESYAYAARAMRMLRTTRQHGDAVKMAQRVRTLDPNNERGDAAAAELILLQQLAYDRWDTEGKARVEAIKGYDPTNAHGVLEDALWGWALHYYRQGNTTRVIEVLRYLIRQATTLRNAQDAYGLLGFALADHGQRAEAIAMLQQALDVNPAGRSVALIKQRLAELQAK